MSEDILYISECFIERCWHMRRGINKGGIGGSKSHWTSDHPDEVFQMFSHHFVWPAKHCVGDRSI